MSIPAELQEAYGTAVDRYVSTLNEFTAVLQEIDRRDGALMVTLRRKYDFPQRCTDLSNSVLEVLRAATSIMEISAKA